MNSSYGMGSTTAVAGYPADTIVKESTALEAHLSFLKNLNKSLYDALDRSSKCADRLFGAMPPSIAGKGDSGPKSAAEPPMVTLVEEEARQCAQLTEAIHGQLKRLERL